MISQTVGSIKNYIRNGFFFKNKERYGHIVSVGILMDNLASSQLYFYAAMKCGGMLQKRADYNFTIYAIKQQAPVMWPQFAIYDAADFANFTGVGIAASLSTLDLLLRNNNLDKAIFYVYNIVELFYLPKEVLVDLRTKNITIITRNEDYRKTLQEHFGLKVSKHIVPDFNVEKLLKVIEE